MIYNKNGKEPIFCDRFFSVKPIGQALAPYRGQVAVRSLSLISRALLIGQCYLLEKTLGYRR